MHTAQALVMFQADSDFYQYTTATAAEGDTTTAWQPTAEQVIQGGELIFRTQVGEGEAEGDVVGESQDRAEGQGGGSQEEEREEGQDGDAENQTELQMKVKDEASAEAKEDRGEAMDCESQAQA